jgi:hypothetical protein
MKYGMNLFEELTWIQFTYIDSIKKLPLHEQVTAYNQYIQDLSIARQNWINYQNKGPLISQTPPTPIESGFLLQEDLFDLLQEDGSNIIITSLP